MLPVVEQCEDDVVKRMTSVERARTWIVDYSAARARAIEWLGDRYLLARPINSSESSWHKGLLHSQSAAVGPTERSR